MSATNRGTVRIEGDAYYTPGWCVDALLNAVPLPGGVWLEPACGDGAIIRAVSEFPHRDDVITWRALDIDGRGFGRVPCSAMVGDFLQYEPFERFDVAITNPPYTLAMDFVQKALEHASVVVMLLRLPWLASQKRSAWLKEHCPDVYVLPKRPSFTGGATDATDYAWMVWTQLPQRTGRVQILDLFA